MQQNDSLQAGPGPGKTGQRVTIAPESEEGGTGALSLGRLLPTQAALLDLREKFLSVFDVASILEGQKVPAYCLQRDITPPVLGTDRAPIGPFPGNDFHVFPSIAFEPESWSACLQLEGGGNESAGEALVVPFSHFSHHGQAFEAKGLDDIEAAAEQLRGLWPDDQMSPFRPRWRLGPQLSDPQSPLYHTFHWLCSKELNGEVVDARILSWSPGTGRFIDGQFDRPPLAPLDLGSPAGALPSAEVWSITKISPAAISIPALAGTLCLMSNPNKSDGSSSDDVYADRDLSWCFDALHGLCRLKGPAEGKRDLSHSLGTSSDCWMYLHFIFHQFAVDLPAPPPGDGPLHRGSGLRVDRRSVSISIAPGRTVRFTESRRWIGARVATGFRARAPDVSPAVVLLNVSDNGHPSARMREQDWDRSGIQSPTQAAGVALFLQFLWGNLNEWEVAWGRCLKYLEDAFSVTIDDLEDSAIESLMSTDTVERLRTYVAALELLHFFRMQIKVVPRSLLKMHKTWERTYVGVRSEMVDRFDRDTQRVLLQNWGKILAHGDAIQGRLLSWIREIEERVKDLRLHVSTGKAACG